MTLSRDPDLAVTTFPFLIRCHIAKKQRLFRVIRCEIRSTLRRTRYRKRALWRVSSSLKTYKETNARKARVLSYPFHEREREKVSFCRARERRPTQIWTNWRPVKYTEHGEKPTRPSPLAIKPLPVMKAVYR